eukprot:scaffold1311_cov256-Pinguiococcus_pyrenoidosus.AAC.32
MDTHASPAASSSSSTLTLLAGVAEVLLKDGKIDQGVQADQDQAGAERFAESGNPQQQLEHLVDLGGARRAPHERLPVCVCGDCEEQEPSDAKDALLLVLRAELRVFLQHATVAISLCILQQPNDQLVGTVQKLQRHLLVLEAGRVQPLQKRGEERRASVADLALIQRRLLVRLREVPLATTEAVVDLESPLDEVELVVADDAQRRDDVAEEVQRELDVHVREEPDQRLQDLPPASFFHSVYQRDAAEDGLEDELVAFVSVAADSDVLEQACDLGQRWRTLVEQRSLASRGNGVVGLGA